MQFLCYARAMIPNARKHIELVLSTGRNECHSEGGFFNLINIMTFDSARVWSGISEVYFAVVYPQVEPCPASLINAPAFKSIQTERIASLGIETMFKPSAPRFGGLLWYDLLRAALRASSLIRRRKIPWRLSAPRKARQRKRLRLVDKVVDTVSTALQNNGGMTAKAVERWYKEMPREEEMLPKDKYTIYDRKEKTYRKGIHSERFPGMFLQDASAHQLL